MQTTLNLSIATPAEIDEVLFPLWAQRWHLAEFAHNNRRDLEYTADPEGYKAAHPYVFTEYFSDKPHLLNASHVERWTETLAQTEADLAAVQAQIDPIDAEYERRGGWSRYVLVNGGHLHKNHCHTLRPRTARFLLAESSGLDAAAVVAKYSYTACTHCFPDAPVATAAPLDASKWCAGSGTYEADDEKGSKGLYRPYGRCKVCGRTASLTTQYGKLRNHQTPDQERAALLAKNAADPKALTEPVRIRHGEVRTIVAARNAAKDTLRNLGWYGVDSNQGAGWLKDWATLSTALRLKGVEIAPLVDRWAKDLRKEGSPYLDKALAVIR